MIYTNFVELENIMFHAKFQDHRTISSGADDFKGFSIYGNGSHLGHVTQTISINFCPPLEGSSI